MNAICVFKGTLDFIIDICYNGFSSHSFDFISSFLCSGESVSMFDSMALAFHTKFDSYGKEPKVIIATSVNPKIVGGMLFCVSYFLLHSYVYSSDSWQALFVYELCPLYLTRYYRGARGIIVLCSL